MTPLLLVLGLGLLAFSWWGLDTVSGRRSFDEMAGMIPMAGRVAGLVMVAIAMGTLFLQWRRSHQ